MAETESSKGYRELCESIRNSKSACCDAPIGDDGTCFEGCCDRWKCSKCGKSWLQELGD